MKIDELGYVEEMRQRLGLEKDDQSADEEILSAKPLDRVSLIAGWYLGDPTWARSFKHYFESQGLYLTTDKEANGII